MRRQKGVVTVPGVLILYTMMVIFAAFADLAIKWLQLYPPGIENITGNPGESPGNGDPDCDPDSEDCTVHNPDIDFCELFDTKFHHAGEVVIASTKIIVPKILTVNHIAQAMLCLHKYSVNTRNTVLKREKQMAYAIDELDYRYWQQTKRLQLAMESTQSQIAGFSNREDFSGDSPNGRYPPLSTPLDTTKDPVVKTCVTFYTDANLSGHKACKPLPSDSQTGH